MPVLVFFPKGHFNVYDRVGRGTGTPLYSFKPYHEYKIHCTKQYALASITIMFYLEDMIVQKEENFIQLFTFYPNDPHLYYLTIISCLQ